MGFFQPEVFLAGRIPNHPASHLRNPRVPSTLRPLPRKPLRNQRVAIFLDLQTLDRNLDSQLPLMPACGAGTLAASYILWWKKTCPSHWNSETGDSACMAVSHVSPCLGYQSESVPSSVSQFCWTYQKKELWERLPMHVQGGCDVRIIAPAQLNGFCRSHR